MASQNAIDAGAAGRAGLGDIVRLLRAGNEARLRRSCEGSGEADAAKGAASAEGGVRVSAGRGGAGAEEPRGGGAAADEEAPQHAVAERLHPSGAAPWRFACRIRNFLSPRECRELIAFSERCGYETLEGVYPRHYRSNFRVMVDSDEVAALLWERAKPLLPGTYFPATAYGARETSATAPTPEAGEELRPVGMNARMRFCRYSEKGDKFEPHCDGAYIDVRRRRESRWTFMLYRKMRFQLSEPSLPSHVQRPCLAVNTVDAADGGSTDFLNEAFEPCLTLQPEAGSVVRCIRAVGDMHANELRVF